MTGASAPIEIAGLRKVFRQTTSGQSIVAIDRLRPAHRAGRAHRHRRQDRLRQVDVVRSADRARSIRPPAASPSAARRPMTTSMPFRGKIATIFQQDRLLPWRSALDNVKLPLELIGVAEDVQQRTRDDLAEAARAREIRQCLSARTVRRHAPARRHRARLRGAAGDPAGRRILRRIWTK